MEIGLLTPAAEGVHIEVLTAWEPGQRRLELLPGASAALAAWAGVTSGTAESAIRDRAAALTALQQDGQQTSEAVAAAVRRV